MNKKALNNTEFVPRDFNPHQRLKYLDFLHHEDSEEDYIEAVRDLLSSLEGIDIADLDNDSSVLVRIIQHCLNASGKLFLQNLEADAFDLLESARNIISETKSKDLTLEKIKTVLYNNISSYCIGLGEDSMAVKFLQNCLRDDAGTNSNLTCIFYNNLASIYLTHANYERAFWYTKKSIYLLEPEIFEEIKEKSSKALKEDPAFLKKLTVLLIGYLNMGSTLEGYQSKTPDSDSSREMLEMNPKDFFKNSYSLAKRYLGPDHNLTERLEYCNTKSEFMLFKETPSEVSDIDMQNSPQQKLKHMLNSFDNEGRLSVKKPRFKMSSNFSNSMSTRSLPKNFQIRKSSYQRPVRLRNKIDSSATSYDSSVEGFEPHRIASYYHNEYSRHKFHPEESYSNSHYRRPRSGMSRKEAYQHNSFVNSPDQTQILMQVMLQQQRELEEKLYRKFEELKSVSKFNSFDNTELKTLDSKDKDDPKVQLLEKEVETLRNKLLQMNVEREMEQRNRKKEMNTEAPRKLSSESSASYQANGVYQPEIMKKNPPSHVVVPPAKVEQIPKQKEVEKIEKPEKPEKPMMPVTKPATFTSENPHKLVPSKPVQKTEKEVFEHKKDAPGPVVNASPISKDEKFYEPNPRKKNWIPGKYSDPKSRKFVLDIGKLEGLGFDEEYRDRGEEEKFEAPAKPIPEANAEPKPMTNQPIDGPVTIAKPTGGLKRGKVEKGLGAKPNTPGTAPEEEEPKTPEVVNKTSVSPVQKNGATSHTEEPKIANIEAERTIKSDTSDRYRSFNIESMDSPKVGNRMTASKLPKYAVLKKKVFLEDDAPYTLVCTARWTQAEKVFKLQLIQDEEKTGIESSKDESKLELPYHDLCRILEHVEYKDVMPVTFHINQIKTFYTLMRHLLLPFTTVITTEEGKKEIAIYPKPPNLLTNSINDMPIIKFLGIQCVIIFTHVIRNTFRIILTDPESVDEAVRIDVDFDKTSFEKCFQKFNGSEATLRSAENSVKIIQGFDDDADDDEVGESKDIQRRMLDPARCDEEELDSFKVINKDLVDDLGNILKEMDAYLTSIGITELSHLADERKIKYCKLKVTNKMKKSTLHFVLDKPEKQILEVKVKNFFETFAPDGKIKALGEYNYPYDSVWKNFGLTYPQLEAQDKIAICSLVSDIYHLDIFENELQKDDHDRYEENAISFVSLEVGLFNRTFLGDKHKFPLTLSLVGIRGEPKGIRATIYNVDDAYEVGGFFHINPTMWAIGESENKKKKKAGRMATLTLIEHYYLDFILRKCGWEILKDWLLIERKPLRIDIKGIKVNKGCRHMEQLENILDSGAVLKYLMEKDNETDQ